MNAFKIPALCFSALTICFVFAACSKNNIVLEEQKVYSNAFWHYDSLANFTFKPENDDKYALYLTLRNSDSYESCNMHLVYTLTEQKDTLSTERKELILTDCNTGQPLGKSVGTFFDYEFPLKENIDLKAGKNYLVSFKQFMRQDTLKGVHAVGFQLRKMPND